MAKKIQKQFKVVAPGGQATPAPPLGPALGANGIARDEDLVLWNGSVLSVHLDASAHGLSESLDLDAVQLVAPTGHLLLSFDLDGSVGGVEFRDEDLLELDPGTGSWELAYDASTAAAAWSVADTDALFALTDVDDDGVGDRDELPNGTDPTDPDSDGDGLDDGVETDTGTYVGPGDTGTDPLDDDTDGDGWLDGYEVAHGSDPLDPDSVPSVPVPALTDAALAILMMAFVLIAITWLARPKSEGSLR